MWSAQRNAIESRSNRTIGWRYRATIAYRFYLFMITSFSRCARVSDWCVRVSTTQHVLVHRTLKFIHAYTHAMRASVKCEWGTLRAHQQFVTQWSGSDDARSVITCRCDGHQLCCIVSLQFQCTRMIECIQLGVRGRFHAQPNFDSFFLRSLIEIVVGHVHTKLLEFSNISSASFVWRVSRPPDLRQFHRPWLFPFSFSMHHDERVFICIIMNVLKNLIRLNDSIKCTFYSYSFR